MKKIISILIYLLITSQLLNAQNLTPSVISSNGSQIKTNGIYFSYTVGEISTSVLRNTFILTQGFEQPVNMTVKQIRADSISNNCEINVYPNPTMDIINAKITSKNKLSNININIYNVLGSTINLPVNKLIYENFATFEIDFTSLTKGNYIIKFLIDNKIYTYQVVKF